MKIKFLNNIKNIICANKSNMPYLTADEMIELGLAGKDVPTNSYSAKRKDYVAKVHGYVPYNPKQYSLVKRISKYFKR